MKSALVLVLLLAALPLAAADYEQVLLPIAPSLVTCGYHSRYDTRLLMFNDNDRVVDGLAPQTGVEITGAYSGGTPMPRFMYLSKDDAAKMSMKILIESSEQDRPEERSYTEVPVVRASDFTSGKMQMIVRLDPEFRQTVRIYGLDGKFAQVMMRVYPIEGGEMLHSCVHDLYATQDGTDSEGRLISPSFGMECDMSEHVAPRGQQVRIELEPITPGKYWAWMSITNNTTQHFYTVLPR